MTYTLTNPPAEERRRELWLQHAAGFILFQDMRKYAIDQIPAEIDYGTKEKIMSGKTMILAKRTFAHFGRN